MYVKNYVQFSSGFLCSSFVEGETKEAFCKKPFVSTKEAFCFSNVLYLQNEENANKKKHRF